MRWLRIIERVVPEIGCWKLVTGNWELEIGSWKLVTRN